MPRDPRTSQLDRSRVSAWLVAGCVVALAVTLLMGASALRDRQTGDRFDLFLWQRDTLMGYWTARIGAPLRDDPPADEAIRRYFAAPPQSEERRRLENAVEAAIASRVHEVLRESGLRGRVPFPGGVFPPVAFELASSPRVLVRSPRSEVRRLSTELLRPDLGPAEAEDIERTIEERAADVSALVVPSGGLATYPAIVLDRGSYATVVSSVAHEWLHHYLAFYRLGIHYFASADATAINETVADLVGDEVAEVVIARWGDPTRPGEPAAADVLPDAEAPEGEERDVFAVLRALRLEVDALLEAGEIALAEERMEAVRASLEADGIYIRRINQAYFAWYGTYAARPDAVDPLGAQLREIRERADSLVRFVVLVRDTASREEVEALLARLRASEAG